MENRFMGKMIIIVFLCIFSFPANALSAQNVTYTYDALNRLTSAKCGDFELTYSYDSAGNIIKVVSVSSSSCECSGVDVIIQNRTFSSGLDCQCNATSSMTLGPNVTIESNARVRVVSPKVTFKTGVHVEDGADLKINQ